MGGQQSLSCNVARLTNRSLSYYKYQACSYMSRWPITDGMSVKCCTFAAITYTSTYRHIPYVQHLSMHR